MEKSGKHAQRGGDEELCRGAETGTFLVACKHLLIAAKSSEYSRPAQIVETMSFSEDVANFMHVLGPFYEIVYHGQEPENLRHNSSPHPSETEKDHQEDESGYSSSINGTGTEEAGKLSSPS